MKPKNVKLFKQFLKFRGLDVMFMGLYKSYRFKDNPESLDDYLENVDSMFVIQEAFDFNRIKAESSFNAKFWSDLSKRWVKYMREQTENGYYWGEGKKKEKNPVAEKSGHKVPVNLQPAPSVMPEPKREEESAPIVKHDWSGLDLVPLAPARRKTMPQPQPLEIRVCTASGNTVVLSTHISMALVQFRLMSMDMQVDIATNRLVFVFGDSLTYNVNPYSSDIYAITHKTVITYLQKYLNIEFDKGKVYYIKIQEKVWNKDHSRCAVVVTTTYTEQDK